MCGVWVQDALPVVQDQGVLHLHKEGENTVDKTLKALDTFSGYGGFTLAMQEHGIETIGFSEIDEYASGVLAYRFPKVKNYGNIDNINAETLPNFDILTGGFPCQDLSVAGQREGLSGDRSGLFYSWLTLLRRKAPSYFILENVKGLYSSQKGWDFAELLYQVSNAGLGYDVQWGTVNSNIYTPQNRERVFIVGCARDRRTRQVFPIEGEDRAIQVGEEISYCLDSNYWKGASANDYFRKHRRQLVQVGVYGKGNQGQRAYDIRGLSATLKAEGGGWGAKTGLYQVGTRIRRLTPRECERLMGIPDDWTKWYMQSNGNVRPVSDTQRYRMCGNGVVPQVVTEILRRLI